MKNWWPIALIVGAPAALAHHSSAPHFDAEVPVSISGVVTEFRFVNPHAYVYLDVTGDDGEVTSWNCEMTAATKLRRDGWTEDLFRPGQTGDIEGIAARRDPQGCSFQSGVLEDGTTIGRDGSLSSKVAAVETLPADNNANRVEVTSIYGTWRTQPRQRNRGPRGGPGRGGPDRFAQLLTEEGKVALAGYDMRFDDPALECSPSSIIRGWGEPNGISQIERMPGRVIIRHEYMDTVRTVHMAREYSKDFEQSLTGYSVGWFEGSDLVIETIGFKPGVLMPHPGLLHTADMRVVERLVLSDDGQHLTREYQVSDPRYLKEPLTGRSVWDRTDIPLSPFNCTELSGASKIRPGE